MGQFNFPRLCPKVQTYGSLISQLLSPSYLTAGLQGTKLELEVHDLQGFLQN